MSVRAFPGPIPGSLRKFGLASGFVPVEESTSPWYERDCYVTKLLEKAYRLHPGPTTLARSHDQFQQKFASHCSDKINSCRGDSKRLWSRLKYASVGTPVSLAIVL